jgi:type VI secretion system secreted protein Hcp
MEEVMYTYKKIKWTWEIDGVEAEDSWIVPK